MVRSRAVRPLLLSGVVARRGLVHVMGLLVLLLRKVGLRHLRDLRLESSLLRKSRAGHRRRWTRWVRSRGRELRLELVEAAISRQRRFAGCREEEAHGWIQREVGGVTKVLM